MKYIPSFGYQAYFKFFKNYGTRFICNSSIEVSFGTFKGSCHEECLDDAINHAVSHYGYSPFTERNIFKGLIESIEFIDVSKDFSVYIEFSVTKDKIKRIYKVNPNFNNVQEVLKGLEIINVTKLTDASGHEVIVLFDDDVLRAIGKVKPVGRENSWLEIHKWDLI